MGTLNSTMGIDSLILNGLNMSIKMAEIIILDFLKGPIIQY